MSGLPADSSRVRWMICAALFVATMLLFSRAWQNDFVNYDDPDYVTANPHVQGGFSGAGVKWALTAKIASNWHPLTWMSHMIDWSLFGDNPRGHHATSVVLHALNAVLAFLALRRLTGAVWTSAIFAALFAWHPLRVESVAWVSERKDVLSGFFWFAVLWAHAVYVERRRERRGSAWGFYGLALVAFALGLMSKPMLVTLPCVLLLLDYWPLRRFEGGAKECWWIPLVEKLPFFALVAVSAWMTYDVQQRGGSVSQALDFGQRLGNAIVATVRYIGKFIWPFDLAALYPHPGYWPVRKVVASLAILLALTTGAVWQVRRRAWVAIGWFWFLGTLVPVVGLVQVGLQSMADRYTYLPMLGVQLAVLWTMREWIVSPSARRFAALGASVVLLACAVRTWNQIGVWKNSFTLFDHAIAVTERNYVAHDNRGLFQFKAGKIEEALADYRRALAINPSYMNANNNLGHALAQLGRPAEAIPFYRTAMQAAPSHLEVRNNLANALSDVGQLDEAMEHYDFVLAANPRHANALNGSGVVLAMRGRAAEAKARIEQSVQIAPNNAGAHNNLGNVCSILGQLEEAARHYALAAKLQPDAQTHAQLGFTLAQLGRREEAAKELREALRLRPDHAQAKAWLEAVMK